MSVVTFNFFTSLLLGDDTMKTITDENNQFEYVNTDDEIELIPFMKLFEKTLMDLIIGFYNPISWIIPFVNKYNLINPFTRNKKNIDTIKNFLSEVIPLSKDEDSAYKKGITSIDDLIGYMIGGTDTTAFTMTSLLYYLKKNPRIEKKLHEELKTFGLFPGCDAHKLITKDRVHSMDYLAYVIKETLRMDPPTVGTFPYIVKRDVEICGVLLKKGTNVRPELLTPHYNPNEWKKPMEFVPERFDPESEWFQVEGEKKGRDINSWLPFSRGMRG
jgi:hypothetical protein